MKQSYIQEHFSYDATLMRYNTIRTELCSIILNGTTDVNEIAKITRRSCKKTISYLEDLIDVSKSSYYAKSQQVWRAFCGAYIDYQKMQIVLAAPVHEMLVEIDDEGNSDRVKEHNLYAVLSMIASLIYLCVGVYASPTGMVEIMTFVLITGVFAGYSLFAFIKARRLKAATIRTKKYLHMISDEKITSIQKIADRINRSPKFVVRDLKNAIINKVVFNIWIDEQNGEVVVGENKPYKVKTARSQTIGKLTFILSVMLIGLAAFLLPTIISELIH